MMDDIENDWNDEERREYERHSVEFYLCVYEQGTNQLLGSVIDISLGGMRLLSEERIAKDKHLRVWMDVSLESGRKEKIALEAHSVWSSEDLNPGSYDTGFQFENLSPQALQSIQTIIDELSGDILSQGEPIQLAAEKSVWP